MIRITVRWAVRFTAFALSSFLFVAISLVFIRAMALRNSPDLEWWHIEEITSEFSQADSGSVFTLDQYLAREDLVFNELRGLVERNAPAGEDVRLNRYRKADEAYAGKSGRNWNRSYELHPAKRVGGVLLLHGMTDSPYTLRHLAAMFQAQGFYVLNLRLPGHGTIPGELDRVQWQDWQAAVALGARHVAGQLEPQQPFYIVGYSNGASLALKYSMDSISDAAVRVPDRLFLLSPMIGVASVARVSRVFYWLGQLEYFRQSRWLDIYPEYDPHKYNSFPMNAGLQSYKLTMTVKQQLARMSGNGELQQMPPILTFQSLVDKTVVVAANFDSLYEKLPANGSELVVFDVNHVGELDEFIQPRHKRLLDRTINGGSGKYALSVLTNQAGNDPGVVELRRVAGIPGFVSRNLPYRWPEDVYSLSHVALPFPLHDEVYGLDPVEPGSGFPHLGRVQMLGESGTLILPPALLQRLRSNPFYGYIEERLEAVIREDT